MLTNSQQSLWTGVLGIGPYHYWSSYTSYGDLINSRLVGVPPTPPLYETVQVVGAVAIVWSIYAPLVIKGMHHMFMYRFTINCAARWYIHWPMIALF